MDVSPKAAAAVATSVSETNASSICPNPSSIYLLSRDREGGKLLFRYPFQACGKPVPSTSAVDLRQLLYMDRVEIQETGLSYSDDAVLSLLDVNFPVCGHRFELKVKNLRFVGHPMLMKVGGFIDWKRPKKTVLMVHVVFALSALVHHQVVDCYYELSKALAIAICHEEKRCVYFSTQIRLMASIIENRVLDSLIGNCVKGCQHFEKILKCCRLAKDMKNVFDDVCANNVIKLKVNNWVEVSVCLTHKVHRFYKDNIYFGLESLKKCLIGLRPYHGLLLLTDRKVLLNKLSQDSSPSIVRLINMYSPAKSLQTLSADSDLTLAQVFNIAGHLIYWGDSIAIFPLSANNLYAVAPNVPTKRNNDIAKKFKGQFPEHNLSEIMSLFSIPITIRQILSVTENRKSNSKMIQIVIWLLQHKILLQYHTYIYFMPSDMYCYKIPDQDQDFNIDKLSELPMTTYQTSKNTKQRLSKPNSTIDSNTEQMFNSLDKHEQDTILNIVKSSNNLVTPDDARLMLNFAKNGYFSGEHHIEEIMFLENITRSELLHLVERFKQVLITVEMEDPVMSSFYSH